MAERLLGGILGDDDVKVEVEPPEASPEAEGFAAAVAARLSSGDPDVTRDTSRGNGNGNHGRGAAIGYRMKRSGEPYSARPEK